MFHGVFCRAQLIFINELPDIVKHTSDDQDVSVEESTIVVFADDNSSTTTHENPAELLENSQRDANIVTDWFGTISAVVVKRPNSCL